ncbi:MAG: FG-GAP-like repeat-containing protein [Balneolaceae bacterium]
MIRSPVGFILVFAGFFVTLFSCSPNRSGLEWAVEEGYRWADLPVSGSGGPGFNLLSSSQTNIQFQNELSERFIAENRFYLNGSGVAAADVDGDGLTDLYFARLDGPNKLYQNLGGYRFRDITEQAGVSHDGFNSTGVAFADVNGNGFPDLFVSSLTDGNALYINDGTGTFTLKEDSGLGRSRGAHTLALADINGNGYLDLYIANYKPRSVTDVFPSEDLAMRSTVMRTGEGLRVRAPYDQYYTIIESQGRPIRVETGEPDELYLNRGYGRFERADPMEHFLDEDGDPVGLSADWGLTATFRDVNGNGFPDLYVANDFWTPDRFWINQGDGTFRAVDSLAIRNLSFSSMGVDFSDINRDGHLDIFVTEMLSQSHRRRMRQASQNIEDSLGRALNNRNSLYLNRGDSSYAQIAYYSGLEASEWSWATYFMDLDLDGYEDLVVATGYPYDYLDMDTQFFLNERRNGPAQTTDDILEYPPLELANRIFRNNGDLTFTDRSREWGFVIEDLSMGMALADLDNDGTQDLIINRLNDEAVIYENRIQAPRIAVRLKGKEPNTKGIGAKIELRGGHRLPDQRKEVTAGGNYLSGSQAQVVFAAEEQNTDHEIIVRWPGGEFSRITNARANRIYEIDQESASEVNGPVLPEPKSESDGPLFEEVSGQLNHIHHENDFDDFEVAPLLPHRLSRVGPGVAWLDITGNNREELLVGSGRGEGLSVFFRDTDGRFVSGNISGLTDLFSGDQTSLTGWGEGETVRLAVGISEDEQKEGESQETSAMIYELGTGGKVISQQTIPGNLSSTGPLASADVNQDGWVDIFIGGRFRSGQYPMDADGRLFLNNEGTFVEDTSASQVLNEIGLVTGAVFSDLTDNGWPDLLVSTEWGTLKLFENSGGRFREVTEEKGLDRWHGWWQGISTGDFTGNGRPDIVASNLGLNSPYQIRDGRELRLYYEDINWDGELDIIDSYFDRETGGYVPRKRLFEFGTIPTILNQVGTHREYAESTIDEIFALDFDRIPYKRINTLEHMIFINEGDGFTGKALPEEAQFSAAFHVGVGDIDNDGKEDLFISQNFFGFPDTFSRQDAGRGLLLKGDGQGGFRGMSGNQSGIKIFGEQRGAALNDFNQDGRVDLAVTQNSGETRLYLNKNDRAGLRVRLEGPPANRYAIGSSIRLIYSDGSKGPRREIQGGSGYGSQDSRDQVLGWEKKPEAIEVRWFDGRTEEMAIPDLSQQIVIRY